VTVRDVVREPLWTVRPSQRAADAAAELAARGFDVAGLAEDPVGRYVRRADLEHPRGRAAGAARPILASEVVSADLPLSELVALLAERPHLFVLDRDRIRWVVTCADLQAPAVGMVVLAYLVAIESGLAHIVVAELGEGWFETLPVDRKAKAQDVFAQRERRNAEIGLADCLYFGDWLLLAARCEAVRAHLGYGGRRAFEEATGFFIELRNGLAHGGTLLDGAAPDRAIRRFESIRNFADRVWDILGQRHEQWDVYAATILTVQGRRTRLSGPGARRRLPAPGPLHILTAWNPGSVTRPVTTNRAANQQLARLLEGRSLEPVPVVGASPDRHWREESLLVAGLRRAEAAELGERFGQVAVFELTEDELRVVRCPDAEIMRSVPRIPTRLTNATVSQPPG
jgi:uncharacterized protein DUF3293